MSKKVISWLAFNKDYIENEKWRVSDNTQGPTLMIHKVEFPSQKI
jgi:hypothetical protein